jgi:hypothetical protein
MGPTHAEMAFHGGGGTWTPGIKIPGKTGINGDVKTSLSGGHADGRTYAGIEGLPRYLPIYEDVSGNGSNARFTLIEFGAVRVVDSNMNGGNKWVRLQPIRDVNHVMTVHLVR